MIRMFEQRWRKTTHTFKHDHWAIFICTVLAILSGRAAANSIGYDTVFPTGQNNWAGEQVAMQIFLPVDGTLESITSYLQAGPPPNTKLRCAIYTDDGGDPGTLIVESAVVSKGAGNVWKTIDLPDTSLAAGTYWLAMTTSHQATKYRYDDSCGQVRHIVNDAVNGGFLANWGASSATYARRISMYATFDVGAVPGLFVDVSSTVGFNVETTTSENEGSGLYWADLDADGDLDVIITGDASKLLINNGAGASFTAQTFGDGTQSRQGALLDIDNDGDIDFWHRTNVLYENDGFAGFTNAGNLGFEDSDGATNEGITAADVNGDGWCDLVVFALNGNWIGHHGAALPSVLNGTKNLSFGLNTVGDAGDGDYCAVGDVNNDGAPDFFYHYGNGKLFRSNGDGTYGENAGGIVITSDPAKKIGSAWGDYDNDGDLDLFVPGFDAGSTGRLWRNDSGLFTNVTAVAGLNDTTGQRSACWGDYDNDGDLDLYIVTHSGAANVLYRNQGNGTFTSVDEGANVVSDGQDAVFVDYDNDGDLDLALTNGCALNVLLRNTTDDANYLKVRVIGAGAGGTNRSGIGVWIELYDADGTIYLARRSIGGARGFGGTEPLWVHFGGMNPAAEYEVRVHFGDRVQSVTVRPDAVSTTIGSRTISQMVTIEESVSLQLIRWTETDPVLP